MCTKLPSPLEGRRCDICLITSRKELRAFNGLLVTCFDPTFIKEARKLSAIRCYLEASTKRASNQHWNARHHFHAWIITNDRFYGLVPKYHTVHMGTGELHIRHCGGSYRSCLSCDATSTKAPNRWDGSDASAADRATVVTHHTAPVGTSRPMS